MMELIGDFFRSPPRDHYLNRVYQAFLLSRALKEIISPEISVTIDKETVKILCPTTNLAALAKMKRSKILTKTHKILGIKSFKLQIILKRN